MPLRSRSWGSSPVPSRFSLRVTRAEQGTRAKQAG
jgi:hypothetical protein